MAIRPVWPHTDGPTQGGRGGSQAPPNRSVRCWAQNALSSFRGSSRCRTKAIKKNTRGHHVGKKISTFQKPGRGQEFTVCSGVLLFIQGAEGQNSWGGRRRRWQLLLARLGGSNSKGSCRTCRVFSIPNQTPNRCGSWLPWQKQTDSQTLRRLVREYISTGERSSCI